MGAHQGDVSVAGIQDFEDHVHLPAVVILLGGEILGFVISPGGPADVQHPIVDVCAGALPQVGSLQADREGTQVSDLQAPCMGREGIFGLARASQLSPLPSVSPPHTAVDGR